MTERIERDGYSFAVEVERDQFMGEPWKEHDGHGPVTDWVRRGKNPGERVLNRDGDSYRYYDVQEAMKLALKDGWGPREPREGESKREAAARAVDEDFASLKAWCDDEWYWVSVIVTLLDAEGEPTRETESCGGIESDASEYLDEVAGELADEIVHRLKGANTVTRTLRAAR